MVNVNKDLCISCGSCVAIAPDNFDFDEEGLAEVKNDELNDDVKEAAEACPTEAIEIED